LQVIARTMDANDNISTSVSTKNNPFTTHVCIMSSLNIKGQNTLLLELIIRLLMIFIIATKEGNVYVRKTILTRDAFINDIYHLARA
jgi:hypothetical protein